MKYFSIDFIPEKTDVNKKAVFMNLLVFDRKKFLPTLLVICLLSVFAFFIGQYELIFYAILSILIVPKVAEFIIVLSRMNESKTALEKRPVTIDFYADHFVYRYNPTEKFKGNYEKHYAFSSVKHVIDSCNAISFTFGGNDTVFIPKRAFDEEKSKMIYNLIENYFKSKVLFIDI